MRMFLLHPASLLACLIGSSLTRAAYVQKHECTDTPSSHPASALSVNSLQTFLASQLDHNASDDDLLTLVLSADGLAGHDTCLDLVASIDSIDVEINTVKASTDFNSTCTHYRDTWAPRIHIQRPTPSFSQVSTFHLEVQLKNQNQILDCVSANITPAFSPNLRAGLRYGSAAVFLLILVVGCGRSLMSEKPCSTTSPETNDGDSALSSTTTSSTLDHRSKPVLPGVADCLSHFQFMFLAGSLSLRYPGFFQPVVSHLNWFSLFSNTDKLISTHQYVGIRDGIYEINGTYGGTYGLELMTQIVGAPHTVALWLNMAIFIIIISVVIAIGVEMNRIFNRQASFWKSEQTTNPTTMFRYTASRVMRAVLSYFLLPLVSLSAYQVNNAGWLPIWHVSLSIAFILFIVLSFVWLLRLLPTRSLGVLIFDTSKSYQRLESLDEPASPDEHFILVLFSLTFLRGIVIGGLQVSGIAQIALLLACDLVLLAAMVTYRACPVVSCMSISVVSRLATVLLMIAFLPNVASFRVKNAIGYVILVLQILTLLFTIIVPSVKSVLRDYVHSDATEPPPVFGLRQLQNRDTPSPPHSQDRDDSMDDLSPVDYSSHFETRSMSSKTQSHHPQQSEFSSIRSVSLQIDRPAELYSPQFYRPVRSPFRTTSMKSVGVSSIKTDLQSQTSSRAMPVISDSDVDQPDSSCDNVGGKQSASDASSSADTSLELSLTERPKQGLGPRWDDYSFRESDLYFGAPRTHDFQKGPASQTIRSQISERSLGGIWSSLRGKSPSSDEP